MAEIEKFQGFFSYTHLDAEIDPDLVAALAERLEKRVTRKIINARFDIWRDVKNLRTGERWDERIGGAVRTSHVFIVLMTPKWFESAYCRREYQIFKQVEGGIGVGEYVVPILAHTIEKQLENFTREQKETYHELSKRQYKRIIAANFLTLTEDQREGLIDQIADDIEGMIERLRRKAVRAPEIPTQGYGTHFEIDDSGVINFARPDALDRQGNNVDRLKSLHPSLRELSSGLVKTLGRGNIPHWHLRDRAEAYRALVDQDLQRIDFSLLCVEGLHLANADKAALGEKELPPLPPPVRAALDTLLQVHGAFILATAEGLEIIAAEERYRRTPQEETEFRTTAVGFANSLKNRPKVIDPRVASFVLDTVEEIGRGDNPGRSSTIATGIVKNVVITVSAAAALASLTAAAAASQTPALIVGAGTIMLVVGDGLRKSKPFFTLAALVTKGLDKASEIELAKAYKEVSERLKPQLKFVLEAEQWLRRLADQRESGLKWVSNSLDRIKNPKKGQPDEQVGTIRRIAPEMIVLPVGEFMMGSLSGEGDDDERPQHKVTIKNPFAVSISPITRGQFASFVEATNYKVDEPSDWSWRNPGFDQEDDHPVVCVSWHDAQAYLAWLSERFGGKAYRLLSEAEWEYCCRAGTQSTYSTGDSITAEQANFGENAKGTTSVFKFPPNAFGLHDMHGNVWEWCEDNWHDDYSGDPPTDGWSGPEAMRLFAFCAAVPGTTIHGSSARPTATGPSRLPLQRCRVSCCQNALTSFPFISLRLEYDSLSPTTAEIIPAEGGSNFFVHRH